MVILLVVHSQISKLQKINKLKKTLIGKSIAINTIISFMVLYFINNSAKY